MYNICSFGKILEFSIVRFGITLSRALYLVNKLNSVYRYLLSTTSAKTSRGPNWNV